MEVYAPDDQQPCLDRNSEAMTPAEYEVHQFFTDQASIEKFIGFLSLEDRKGKDKFDARRFSLFKGSAWPLANHYQVYTLFLR